jgi:hypothetical protein
MEIKGTEATEMAIGSDGDRDGPEAESPGFKSGVPKERKFEPTFRNP